MAAVAREFRLLNGELVEHEGLAEAESIVEAQQLVAEALKLKAQQIVFFGVSGVLGAGDPLEGDIQVYIQEVKITKEEFLAKACVKLEDAGTMKSLKMTRLCALPADVGDFLPQLTWLTLTNNYLSHCPNSLGQLKNLAKLYLEGNQLSELPESIGDLAALQVLQLDRNQFQNLPSGMFRLANLQELSAKSNQIAELPPEIANLRGNLTQLNLAKNRLSSVPPSIGQLEHLIELVLAENQLLTVPDVLNLQKLKHLDMSFNKLQSLPKSITQAQVLEELLVNNNRISSLPEEIGRLQALRDFNLNANVLVSLPESFGLLENLQNVWLDKGQMMVLPVSSRKLLRVAATLYTSLEDDDLAPTAAPAPTAAAVAPAAAARPAKSPKASKVERVKAIFDQFDLNQDGFIDKEELRTVLQKIRDIGSAISDEMIDMALDQMDTNKDSLINFDEFLAWLYSTRPSTEKHLLRRAVGILEEGESPTSSPASRAAPERREAAPPALTRVSSRALAEQAQRALEALNEEDLVAVLEGSSEPQIRGLLEVLSLLMAGMIPGTDEPLGPLGGAAQLLRQPRYFLNACGETLAWIDEGKLPEENVEAARAVRDALPLSATAVRAAVPCGAAAGQLCEWVMAIFAYFDAVENWEP